MASEKDYNASDVKSILKYSMKLVGSSLGQLIGEERLNYSGKGQFGRALESEYFGLEVNNKAEADFLEAQLELKSSPITRVSQKKFKSKERIVLGKISFHKIVKENFQSSGLLKKNSRMLLVFYEYLPKESFRNHIIRLVGLWEFPKEDLLIIQRDWELIRDYVRKGQAHCLSESLTKYLSASTKGSNAKKKVNQPNSRITAKPRAFSLKASYVNLIIDELQGSLGNSRSILGSSKDLEKMSLENFIVKKVIDFQDKSVLQIQQMISTSINVKAKGGLHKLTKHMLGLEANEEIMELQKSQIKLKTIRLDPEGKMKESISFPPFKYEELCKSTWYESRLYETLDTSRFAFVVFQYSDDFDELCFKGICFWSMPSSDIAICRKVWLTTRATIIAGKIVDSISANGRRNTNFVNSGSKMCIHVRPHARDKHDTYPLPTEDAVTREKRYTKHSFWLNKSYISDVISECLSN